MTESIALSLDFARGWMKYPHDVDTPSKSPIANTNSGRDIQFSSPMPWVLAIVLSVTIWAAIGWCFWRFI
jgi:hypothetical protein